MVFHETLALFLAYSDLGVLALRVALATVFLYHGWPKVFHSAATAKHMKWSVGSILVLGLVETLSALSVLLGVYPQLGALGMVVVMIGALYFKLFKWKTPFGLTEKPGWAGDLLILAAALVLLTSTYGYVLL